MCGKLHASPSGTVEIYVDDSNIHFGAINQVLPTMEPDLFNAPNNAKFNFRMHQTKLIEKILNGRTLRIGVAVGVALPSQNLPDAYLSGFSNIGFQVVQGSRSGYDHGKETNVDATIQKKMREAIRWREPGTMVLVSGDGNGRMEGKGFIPVLEEAVAAGWKVEVVAWRGNANRYLVEFARTHGKFMGLESSYFEITFVKNMRRVGERHCILQ